MRNFIRGVIAGICVSAIIFGVIAGLVYFHKKHKDGLAYAQKQIEIEALREGIINRDSVEFLDIPGVRGAADGAAAEFERKRGEALQRFRNRIAD